MGALVHGQACYGFTFLLNIKHGSNVTIETLHRVLQDRFEKNDKQPFKQRTLYLQLDNTTKQCKSKYVFCFLALLVAWYLFTVVMLSFLMVGHTHEDIDQLFSRIATYLRKNKPPAGMVPRSNPQGVPRQVDQQSVRGGHRERRKHF